MNAARFEMTPRRKEAERLSRTKPSPDSGAKWYALKAMAQEAMEACDRTNQHGRMDHGGLLLFLCAIEDLEKCSATVIPGEREKLHASAAKKFDSAQHQYDRA
jgi:hypothetical protein